MGADDAADESGIQTVCSVFPQGPAVLHVFFQEHVRQPRVAQEDGQGKVDAAAGTDFFHQQVVALAGAPCLTQQCNLTIHNGDHRLDGKQASGDGNGFGNSAAFFQVFQGVQHNGKIDEGSLSSRLEALANIAFTDGVISVESVTLPKDSVIKVEFTEELSSREDKAGEPVHFKIADNVYVNDVLVLPKGALGEGTIKKVVQPRSFGRDARIDVDFTHVYALDGTKVPVYIGDLAKQEAKTAAGAAGAAIGGMIVLGPIGALGGAFVTGKAVVIPVGSTTYVQTMEDTTIQGMVYQGK